VTDREPDQYTPEKTLPVTGHPRPLVRPRIDYGKVMWPRRKPVLTIIATGGPILTLWTLRWISTRATSWMCALLQQNAAAGNNNNLSGFPLRSALQPAAQRFYPTTSKNLTLSNCQAQAVSLLQ